MLLKCLHNSAGAGTTIIIIIIIMSWRYRGLFSGTVPHMKIHPVLERSSNTLLLS